MGIGERNHGFSYIEAERECRERGELIEDMWALWHNGCDCTECPERVHAECKRDERLGVEGCGAMGVACMQEGMEFVGIDMDPHYCEIADRRVRAEAAAM